MGNYRNLQILADALKAEAEKNAEQGVYLLADFERIRNGELAFDYELVPLTRPGYDLSVNFLVSFALESALSQNFFSHLFTIVRQELKNKLGMTFRESDMIQQAVKAFTGPTH